jgi:hypothetical protein
MAQIDCTLNSLMIPALPGFTPIFGSKKPSGGLRTAEVNDNVLMPFAKQRPFVVSEDSTTTAVEADCRFVFTVDEITLALGDPVFAGCEVIAVNGASGDATVNFSGSSITLAPGDKASLISNAAGWMVTQTAVSTPTANRIALYDANKRLKSGAAPSANNDVLRKADMATIIRDACMPIGFQYVQYASAESNDFDVAFPLGKRPESLWPGTSWKMLWEDERVFFRTGGSLGSQPDRTSGKQDQASRLPLHNHSLPGHTHSLPAHNHGFSYDTPVALVAYLDPGGAPAGIFSGSTTPNSGTTNSGGSGTSGSGGSGTSGNASDSTETKPVNRLMIIWERDE